MDPSTPISNHVRVGEDCDLCFAKISAAEGYVALIDTGGSQTSSPSIVVVLSNDQSVVGSGKWHLCNEALCFECNVSPQVVTVHRACLVLFKRTFAESNRADALEHLFVSVTWRTPWSSEFRPALYWRLEPVRPMDTLTAFYAAELCRVPNFRSLPLEIWNAIRDLSESHVLWRYTHVLSYAKQLVSVGPSYAMVSHVLRHVNSWDRGSDQPKLIDQGPTELPIVRLTIDYRGLKKVERLATMPVFARQNREDCFAFVVSDVRDLENVTVQFKYGLALLHFGGTSSPQLQIWDTPTPPDLEKGPIAHRQISANMRFFTIDVQEITGITFIFRYGHVLAVHPHTRRRPSATQIASRIPAKFADGLFYVYHPVPKADDIVAFGMFAEEVAGGYSIRGHPCFLFRQRLSGDICIGCRAFSPDHVFVGGQGRLSTLVYRQNEPSRPIPIISPLFENPGSSPQSESSGPFLYPLANPPQLSQPNIHFSCASLNDVRSIEIFSRHEDDSLHTRGILLRYGNGGERALGECRIFEDSQKTYKMPTSFCFCNRTSIPSAGEFRSISSAYPLVAIGTASVDTSEAHTHDDQNWECFEMAGMLVCWFNEVEGHLSIIDGKASHLGGDDRDWEDDEENASPTQWRSIRCAFQA